MYEDFVARIHAAPPRGVVVLTGGGSGLVSELLGVAGASNTVLDAHVPYSPWALRDWLGAAPEQACSADTACAMAMVAFLRARTLNDSARDPSFGFALTASLATTRTKRGPHRAHLAMQTASSTFHWHLRLEREARDRAGEERLLSALALRCLGQGLGVDGPPDVQLTSRERIEEQHVEAPDTWQRVLTGAKKTAGIHGATAPVEFLFPGAFNPLHSGHIGMAEQVRRRSGAPVHFEISVRNVDKPPLNFLTLEHRAAQFDAAAPLWLTACPTFVDKARAFPGATFIVGIDTLVRIGNPRYYGNDVAIRNQAIHELADLGSRFLVFGRHIDGRFQIMADQDLPDGLRALCDEVSEEEFREDVSSTAIRTKSALPRPVVNPIPR